jgi:alpha-D-ribose 1-methylphosphonate 5-triphosphate synthase subunit PhnG
MQTEETTDVTQRRGWMAVLARASHVELQHLLQAAPALPSATPLRGPECGLVMVRGRVGGGGGAFNLGEMAVTRASVRLADGTVGHAYIKGRDVALAALAAHIDAAMQHPALHAALKQFVIAPLAAAQQAARVATASRAAATEVQFFTMATMRT